MGTSWRGDYPSKITALQRCHCTAVEQLNFGPRDAWRLIGRRGGVAVLDFWSTNKLGCSINPRISQCRLPIAGLTADRKVAGAHATNVEPACIPTCSKRRVNFSKPSRTVPHRKTGLA